MRKQFTAIMVATLLASNLLLGFKVFQARAASQDKDRDSAYANVALLTRVMEIVRKDYVDGDKLSYRELTYSALKGMLNSLDPHSQFMEPESFNEMRSETEGQFGGIGVQIGVKDNIITIIAPMEDTPGFKAGLLPGDKILAVDGTSTEKLTLQDAVKLLRGKPGSDVTLRIMHSKGHEIKDVKLTRAIIKVDSVKDAKLVGDHIGYVRITQFNGPTDDEFEAALQKLEKQGINGMILDLRNNPGGLLESAVEVAGKFLPRNEMVVYTEGRQVERHIYSAQGKERHPNYPLVVLVNGGSASGSEIVAGALQDLKRAVLVGETTFGKGSVQSVLPMPDGSALRLTTAKYYTPGRKVIHEKGVTPDIVVAVSEEDQRKLMLQRAKENWGDVGFPDADEESDSESDKDKEAAREKKLKDAKPIRDVQLDRAIDVIKGLRVFTQQKGVPATPVPPPSSTKS
ncbi:MAG: S41 family peptidase [Verrucomicrobiae bacterium]|nr:S41 family peptidase [Verrucomicrobiae bacterium]